MVSTQSLEERSLGLSGQKKGEVLVCNITDFITRRVALEKLLRMYCTIVTYPFTKHSGKGLIMRFVKLTMTKVAGVYGQATHLFIHLTIESEHSIVQHKLEKI